jgi:hypothetical protein
MAAATMGSSKIFPHEPTPKLVVSAMLPFKYRWVMTWKRAAAAWRQRAAGEGSFGEWLFSRDLDHGRCLTTS